jgi:hypothetical protein
MRRRGLASKRLDPDDGDTTTDLPTTENPVMKIRLMIAAALGISMLGGCAVYSTGYPAGGYYYYDTWGYDGGGYGHGRRSGGGRSEPGQRIGDVRVARRRARRRGWRLARRRGREVVKASTVALHWRAVVTRPQRAA